jgi:hypothetical protein
LRNLDFSSLHALVTTLLSLAVITLIGVGIRLLTMVTIQQRRERMNRQINERLRALIAAYKTLGGSFTGDLTVDPAHYRDRLRHGEAEAATATVLDAYAANAAGSDRARRIRDAVEAALSDIILLGTEEQVRLAALAAEELARGKPVPTQELVVSLRSFIREALDLDPIPANVTIPLQGPARPTGSAGRDKAEGRKGSEAGGMGMGGGGMSMGMGMGGGMGSAFRGGSASHPPSESDEDAVDGSSPHV